ncbi:RsmD family RNA methyltransferase [Nocardioides gilvus]|uniref:RsmD family RNA methyltransferase n=1 Tax=Nocardioides gilvus TaxID=1735589 RepID=UPI000D7473E7|nr:RsmD family RNA methyltransferase [Nocardioides gilvus]
MPQSSTSLAEHEATSVAYGPLEIAYDSRVLTPRDWTRQQSTWAADLMQDLPDGPILELCSGAGHIGLLAAHLSGRRAVLVDMEPTACHYARLNAETAGLGEFVEVRLARADAALRPDERFACVMVDPPWVPTSEIDRFPEDPRLAIDGGEDGLDVIRDLLHVVAPALLPHGVALVQLGTSAQVEQLHTWLDTPDSPSLTITEVRVHGDRGVVALLEQA